jgi:uncharacterized MAPEG superfamily protein
MLIFVFLAMFQVGVPKLAGNRDDMPELTGFTKRANRGHLNMLENLVLFAIVVIVAQVAGRANATTALGATIFFWARVVYALVYLIGVPWLRTAVWAVSFVGILMILGQLL